MLNDPILLTVASAAGSAIGGTIVGLILKRSLKRYDDMDNELKTLKEGRITNLEKKVNDSDCGKCPTAKKVDHNSFRLDHISKDVKNVNEMGKTLAKVETILERLEKQYGRIALKLDGIADVTSAQAVEIKNNSKYIGNVSRKITEHVNNGGHNHGSV